MIPDFPEVKKIVHQIETVRLRQEVEARAPIYARLKKSRMHEGDKIGIVHENGKHVVTCMQHTETGISISKEELLGMQPDDRRAMLDKLAEDFASQEEGDILQTISKFIEESGNVISAGPGIKFQDMLLKMLEKIHVNFEDDDRGKPVMPTLFAGSEVIGKLKEKESKATPEEREEFHKRREEILDRKYQEYMQELHSRKIVD